MTTDELWAALSDARIEVHRVGDRLRVSNASALTPGLRAGLMEHKEALLKEMGLTLFERAFVVFGGVEINARKQALKRQPSLGRLLD